MRFIYLVLIIFTSSSIIMLFSCQNFEEDLDDYNSAKHEIHVVGKTLHFPSHQRFEDFISKSKELEEGQFHTILRNFKSQGFKSLIELRVLEEIINDYQSIDHSRGITVVDLDGDSLIADDVFAATLNEDREIFVDQKMYKYTFEGIFYGEISDSNLIRTIPDTVVTASSLTNGEYLVGDDVYRSINRPAIDVLDPDPDPDPDPYDPTPSGPGNGGSDPCSLDEEDIKRNLQLMEHDGNFLYDIIGVNEKDFDYFPSNGDKRIKTKVWSQNYILFATTGMKVKSQDKHTIAGIEYWNKTNAEVDKLVLGYDISELVWDIPTFTTTPNIVHHITYDGVTYDLNSGNIVTIDPADPENLFENFPFDEDKSIIELFIPAPFNDILGVSEYELTGEDANDLIKEFVEEAYDFLTEKLQEEFGDEPIAIFSNDPVDGEITVTMVNWDKSKLNENKISELFNWSTAEIGLSTNFVSVNPSYGAPEKPEGFRILMFGYGIDDCEWAGSRIYLNED